MKRNFTIKSLVFLTLFIVSFKTQAQTPIKTFYADGNVATKLLSVDTESPNGASPDGTEGSWYKWTLNNGATFTAGNDPDGAGTDDSNQVTITWNASTSWPSAGGNPMDLIKDYNVIAEEFNSCQPTSTEDSKTEINVKLVKPDILKIEADTEICGSSTATFTLYGTPGGIVYYSVTGSTTPTGNVTIDQTGKVDIQIVSNGSGDIVLTITKVEFIANQPSNQPRIDTFENLTPIAGNSKIIPLKKAPVISEIVF
ncbi:hypothetical protein HXZ94_00290 [Empedobacter falsenii]|uniref:hypothetical protein n=1 Tax=Empedobacter falsenii TaxID=343874 RepID=UPI002575EE7B|nr:hypothetical protein [Empedobacter falsenii]MDM1296942.1 hypothetical protein [Empedobacter falsenii]MDM1316735.1 hypothetical protein [Empedobacter falsenii]